MLMLDNSVKQLIVFKDFFNVECQHFKNFFQYNICTWCGMNIIGISLWLGQRNNA